MSELRRTLGLASLSFYGIALILGAGVYSVIGAPTAQSSGVTVKIQPATIASAADDIVSSISPCSFTTRGDALSHRRRQQRRHAHRSASDNGAIKRVVVNGVEAHAVRENFGEWEASVPAAKDCVKLQAHAEDAAGNVEPRAHVLTLIEMAWYQSSLRPLAP